jgi:pilus assembly protein CpaB
MARPLTNTAVGRTNRRLLLLALAAAIVAAILVYTALSRGSEDTGGAGGAASMAPAVMAKIDIPARTKITTDMVEVRQVPLDTRSDLTYTELSQVVGRVSRYPIATNEQVLSTKVVGLESAAATGDSLAFIIPEGRRGISIEVNEVVSTGGLVLPGDYVDIIGVFDVNFSQGEQERTEERYFARIILQNVEVLAVAQTVVDTAPEAGTATIGDGETTGADGETAVAESEATSGQRARNTEADPNPKAVTVTLSVTPQEAQLLFLAEENGVLRLAVRPYGEADVQDVPFVVETELIPPNLPGPVLR